MKTIHWLTLGALALYLLRPRTGLAGMKKTRFMPVYINGKPNPALVRSSVKRPGAYMIKVNGVLKYVGYSGSHVYKTLIRHFQSWQDPRQVRVTYPRASYVTARVIYTNTARQAAELERALILKYRPEDNPNKLMQLQIDTKADDVLNQYKASEEVAPF